MLYQTSFTVGDTIKLAVPTIGDIFDNEEAYYRSLDLFTSMPIDHMVQLDDIGIDFTTINQWELFVMLFHSAQRDNLNISTMIENFVVDDFRPAQREADNEIVLLDMKTGFTIDRHLFEQISAMVCRIHGVERNDRRPANKEAKEYMIEVERKKQKRRLRRKIQERSELERLIVALVNTEQFKYNYETVRDLSIYQFRESVKQIVKKIDYEHRMHGVYSGTVSVKDIKQEDLIWI